jgi:hypothetical protein
MQGFQPSFDPARGQPANAWRQVDGRHRVEERAHCRWERQFAPQDLHITQGAVQRVGHIDRPGGI